VKKRLAAMKANIFPPGMAGATGIIEDLGAKALSPDIRHRVTDESGQAYFLQGYRQVIDGFTSQKVKVEGRLVTDFRSSAPDVPVVLVTKINLIL